MKSTTKSILAKHEAIIATVVNGNYSDGTYDINTLSPVEFKKGFQVTFYTLGMNYSDSDYDYLVSLFTEFSMDGKTYLGFFDGGAEISWRIADKKTAKRLAKQFNQIAVWDWKHSKCIATKGTGRNDK